ncbi:MAG: hypothetical protein ACK57B_04035 [Betaproteobacteria bacterium]
MPSTDLNASARPGTTLCVLHDVGPCHEVLSLAPLEVFADTWLLKVESLLDTARDPSQTRVRYTTTLDREAMSRLREAIDDALRGKPRRRSARGRAAIASRWPT